MLVKRKLIKQGGGGYTIYLPKRWVKRRNLLAGDTVEVTETDASIIVSATGKSSREADLDITGYSEHFIRMTLMNLYRLGHDRVIVRYARKREREHVKRALQELLGYTIVSDREVSDKRSELVIENVSEPALEKYQALVSRIMFIFDEILKLLAEPKTQAQVKELVTEAYRYDSFCRRAITKQILQEENATMIWAFHLQLIHSIRDAYFLSTCLADRKLTGGTNELLDTIRKMFDGVREAYQSGDTQPLIFVHEKRDLVFDEGYELLRKEDPVVVHHLLDLVRNVYLTSSPLFAILGPMSSTK